MNSLTFVLTFEPEDQDFEPRVRSSFRRQKVMETIGAVLTRVAPGHVEIELPFRDSQTQQHGYVHAGIITAIVDSACGYAVARGRVVKSGRTVSVCAGEVLAATG